MSENFHAVEKFSQKKHREEENYYLLPSNSEEKWTEQRK